MGQYIISDRRVDIFPDKAINIVDKLPLGNYQLRYIEPTGQYYLEKIELSVETTKAYGNHVVNRDRIINTFNNRQKNMGILLSGLKGMGKTFLVRDLSIELKKQGISSTIINEKFDANTMSSFLSRITESVFVIFDEFDKNYAGALTFDYDGDDERVSDMTTKEQNGLLTLLDGIFSNKMLFAFCCNEAKKINDYFIHRPSRIYYHIRFDELDTEVIEQYCNDNLNNKTFIRDITLLRTVVKDFSFDILKSIVEECNAYNESPIKAINYLNINIENDSYYTIKIVDLKTNEVINSKNSYNRSFRFNPLDYLTDEDNSDYRIILNINDYDFDLERFVEICNILSPSANITKEIIEESVTNGQYLFRNYCAKPGELIEITRNGELVYVNDKINLKFILSRTVMTSNINTDKLSAALESGAL